jgi:hypothetical protein
VSEPLKKLDVIEIKEGQGIPYETLPFIDKLLSTLNAAIDRINELEKRYEGHVHYHHEMPASPEYNFITTPPKEQFKVDDLTWCSRCEFDHVPGRIYDHLPETLPSQDGTEGQKGPLSND